MHPHLANSPFVLRFPHTQSKGCLSNGRNTEHVYFGCCCFLSSSFWSPFYRAECKMRLALYLFCFPSNNVAVFKQSKKICFKEEKICKVISHRKWYMPQKKNRMDLWKVVDFCMWDAFTLFVNEVVVDCEGHILM